MKRLTLILFALMLSFHLKAQDQGKTPIGGRPDIKGDLFLDFGFNLLNNRPEEMDTRFFPSRTVNIYFQRPFYLGGNSGFTFNPGIGFGLDKLAFADDQTLTNDPDKGSQSSQLVDIEEIYGTGISVDKNTMALNYIDIPLEFRYHANRSNYNQGFRVALGGKIGVLYNAHTKIKFTDGDGVTQKLRTPRILDLT
ncbi:porin family protein [Echinicola jeungdonensis]|uniref:porin family protein n=1 Tax=Echinicola jeungdonensis TaxID=709343 RepID=UPI00338FE469